MMIKKAVIPAAGFGTRFLPVTKTVAKEMLPIVDTPTIEYIVREALDSGIEEVLIIVNEGKQILRDYFGYNEELEEFLTSKQKFHEVQVIRDLPDRIKVYFTIQHKQLGLGHAVLCAEEFAKGEPFVLLLGDDVYVGREKPATKQMIEAYEKVNSTILGTLLVPDKDVSKYGICELENKEDKSALVKLKSVVEKPAIFDAPSNLAIGGRYILTPTIFKYLHNQTPGKGGEIQLTDSILRMMSEEAVYSLAIDGRRYDIGSKKGFIEATIDFALNREDLHDDVVAMLKKRV